MSQFDAVSRQVVLVVDVCRQKEVEIEVGGDLEIWVQKKAGTPVGVGSRPAAIEYPSQVGGRVETFVVFERLVGLRDSCEISCDEVGRDVERGIPGLPL